jgi:rhodanese-related sulfurtransferase
MNRTFIQSLILLGASFALGLAYNANHPSGIHFDSDPLPPPAAESRPPSAKPTSDPAQLFTHALISAEWMTPATAAPAHAKTQPGLEAQKVSWPEAQELIAHHQAVLIDVRSPIAFQSGHIPGAISVPLQEIATNLTALQNTFPPQLPLIFYCDNANCPQSRTATSLLQERRFFTHLYYFPGGLFEWRAAQASR